MKNMDKKDTASYEALVRQAYEQFPNMVNETLMAARWIIDEKGVGYWNEFYSELTLTVVPTKAPTVVGSETQNIDL